jgi:hypothetical protein
MVRFAIFSGAFAAGVFALPWSVALITAIFLVWADRPAAQPGRVIFHPRLTRRYAPTVFFALAVIQAAFLSGACYAAGRLAAAHLPLEDLWLAVLAILKRTSLASTGAQAVVVIPGFVIFAILFFAVARLRLAEYRIEQGYVTYHAPDSFAVKVLRFVNWVWEHRSIWLRCFYACILMDQFLAGFAHRGWIAPIFGVVSIWVVNRFVKVTITPRLPADLLFFFVVYLAGIALHFVYPEAVVSDAITGVHLLISWLAEYHWFTAWLAIAVACSITLVLRLRISERFNRDPIREFVVRHPELARCRDMLFMFFSLTVWPALFSAGIVFILNWITSDRGYEAFHLPLASRGWNVWIALDVILRFAPLYILAMGIVLILTAFMTIRCLRTPLYDFFVTYKSEDAALARLIVDHLRAAGLRVWFAEYQILLQARDRFQQAIDAAISDCRYGLAFTNNGWAQSRYCDIEIKRLLREVGAERILELRIPPEELPCANNPELARSKSLDSFDPGEILPFISGAAKTSPIPSPPAASNSGRRFQALADGRPCSLLVEGWTLERGFMDALGAPDASPEERSSNWTVSGCYFTYDAAKHLRVNIVAGEEHEPAGRRLYQTTGDREMYDAILKHATQYLSNAMPSQVIGVHLLFQGNLSHFAVTYRILGIGYWTRKVSIILQNTISGATGEFVFTFGFSGSFAEYCRYAHIMDAFALSLEWT